ncbi:MAG TPA: LTA synthase family protein [Pseudoxanthomonas sp.]|nr:LTA synthase family protein [Pseudoxanthomonas sp.]
MFVFSALWLIVLTVSRLGLMLWHGERVTAAGVWASTLLQGVRVDLASVCLALGLPAVVLVLLPAEGVIATWARRLVHLWLVLITWLMVFLELATPSFMAEYGLRPNRQFVEYLIYPCEVANTVIKGHWQSLLVSVPVLLLASTSLWKLMRASLRHPVTPALRWPLRVACAIVVLLVAALGARSTLGHRPLNPSTVATTADPTLNVLPLNSFYSVAHATRQMMQRQQTARLYGDLSLAEVVAEIAAARGDAPPSSPLPALPTLAAATPSWHGKPRNVVIVLEESLGAQFIGRLGGRPLSPSFDRLSEQGWAFDQLYATGTRSVRGIEAVLAGYTPTPAQPILKLPASRQGFYTLARTLQQHRYDTTFYYGGASDFDNMRGFFLSNGFARVIDQKDYANPAFTGSWGVSDEDLFARAHAEFAKLHAAGKPFFGLVFTSSNHDPFEFPDGRIDLYAQPKATRDNAAKYADYALGRFFDAAMQSEYWQDTVFLVVADHDSRVFGQDLVPMGNFHIPGLILGGGIPARRDVRVVSQIDLAPTLLSLAGIADATPMIGVDLTHLDRLVPGRAMMQYDGNFAWRQGNDVVILQPGKPPRDFRVDARQRLLPAAAQPALQRRALAHALWGTQAYEQELHRLPAR